MYGVPRSDLTMMTEGLDLAEAGLTPADVRGELRGDQLIYYPYLQRPQTVYGFSLVEQCLIPIMTGLRKQAMQLNFFDESTTPRAYIAPGDTTMTPNQIRELSDALNAVAGDLSWAFKIMVLPPNSKVLPMKDMNIVDDADNWIATEVAMALNISPMEIGLLPKVSATASPFAAREMSQASRSVHDRTATKPTLSYVQSIFNFILQQVCGQEDMQFLFEGMQEVQDQAALTDLLVKQVQSGIRSIDEARDELHLTPWDLPETRTPVVFTQMGPVPLDEAVQDTLSQIRQAVTGTTGDPRSQRAVESLGRRAAASGQGTRKALPAGTSGQGRMNGPVTQRQARRGGALAPAHATAEGAPGHSGGRPAPKAALAELEALGRHLRKGMPVAEWVPEHVPGTVMAIIADDLSSGLSGDYAVKAAMASMGLAKASPQQSPQSQQRQLARQYQAQVQAALTSAIAQAQALIGAWIAGTLAVTAAVLASMIADLIRAALLLVLRLIWAAAWRAGAKSAAGEAGEPVPPGSDAALNAFLDTWGRYWADLISGTGQDSLLRAIREALAAGDPGQIAGRLGDILDVAGRSEQIAVSEATRAWNAGCLWVMKLLGTGFQLWRNRGDADVCAACKAKTALGPWPAGKPYPDGIVQPPGHTRCRCWLTASGPPKPNLTGKFLRREVGLNGQETWTEWEPEPETTGGRVFYPHRAGGTQAVPGAMTGGEPPRWDGSGPEPVTERAPDADDDAAYGSAGGIGARPGAYWPAPYMDGWWPAPHGRGTRQPSVSSPGSATGRPPNGAGKARRRGKAAEFLKDAPRATPAEVRKVMRDNFPASALGWVGKIRWTGPVDLPLDLVDTANEKEWAAAHQQAHVDDLARRMEDGEDVNPAILVVRQGHNHARLIDGRHRERACRKLGRPLRCYVGYIDAANEKAAYRTYQAQFHSGDSPENKSFTAGNLGIPGAVSGLVPFNLAGQGTAGHEPARASCAGLAVRAADTGRVLMIQRANAEGDPAGGLWEFPGGHAEDGEQPFAAAIREWREETGRELPTGEATGRWQSANGIYESFAYLVAHEADVDLGAPREVANPDGDSFEAVAWWEPGLLAGNPAVRRELRADLHLALAALTGSAAKSAGTQTSAEILREYWRGEAHPGPTQFALERKIRWGEPDDWYRCHAELAPYLGEEGAKGYCNLRHHEVLGYWPAQHAQMERGEVK